MALTAAALSGLAMADIPPVPLPPTEPPPAIAPAAIYALSGRYEMRDATGRDGCDLTLLAEHHDAFVEGRDDFKVATDSVAADCLNRLFGEFGYTPGPLLWNVTEGGGISLGFDGRPPQAWLAFVPDRVSRGLYRVEAMGQMLTLISVSTLPLSDPANGGY